MEAVKPIEVMYPEGLDEAKLSGLIQAVIDSVDRELLLKEERLNVARNPLLHERMGKDIAIDVELFNLISSIVYDIVHYPRGGQRSPKAWVYDFEMLLKSSGNKDLFLAHFNAFTEALTTLVKLNPEVDARHIVDLIWHLIRKLLQMPNIIQEAILYPAVRGIEHGESSNKILARLERCRAKVLEVLDNGKYDNADEKRAACESEVSAVKAWFEKTAQ